MIKYTKLWDGIKNSNEKINNTSGEYEKDFMKIKINADDNLPLNKPLKLHNMTITIRSVWKMVNIIHKFFLINVCMNYKC